MPSRIHGRKRRTLLHATQRQHRGDVESVCICLERRETNNNYYYYLRVFLFAPLLFPPLWILWGRGRRPKKKKEANERKGETQEVYKFVSFFLSFFPLSSLLSMLPSGFHAQWTHTHTVVFVSTLQHPSQSKVFRCGLHVQLGCLSNPFTWVKGKKKKKKKKSTN